MKNLRLFVCVVVLMLLWVPFTVASANSAPTPATVWFVIQANTAKPSEIISVRVIGCGMKDCTEATASYKSDPLTGIGNLYYWNAGYGSNQSLYVRLIIQFSDGEKTSDIIHTIPLNYGSESSYQVTVKNSSLNITRIADIPWPGLGFNVGTFLLTLVAESLTGAFFLMLLKKTNLFDTLKFAGLISLVNLISYPVLWSYFLSIAQFHYRPQEGIGISMLLGGIVFSTFLILAVNNAERNKRIILSIAGIFSIPASCFVCVLSGGILHNTTLIVQGLPVNIAILMIEVCAVIVEALLLYGLTKRQNPFIQMLTVSLIMNLASFGIGLLIYNPFR